MIGRIKISIIADARGELHRYLALFVKRARPKFCVIAQGTSFRREQVLQNLARLFPCWATQRHEGVERITGKHRCRCRRPRRQIISVAAAGDSGSYNVGKESTRFQNLEIENYIADG